jgi:6-phosphogluconolactonase/glucosamine-6-phosphate isomerase/deaminase
MEILREEDTVKAAESWLKNRIARYRATSLFLPAGETPKPLYAKWRQEKPAYLEGVRLQQVDDVIDGPGRGLFARFFAEELPGYNVEVPKDGSPAELAILGFGTNGHIAFHEPHLPPSFAFGEVALEPDTCARLKLEAGTRGISYGAGAFLKARAILLIVKGEGKKAAWDRFKAGDAKLPSVRLKHHPDLTVWTDF